MAVDLVIRNCKIATSKGLIDAGLAVDEGKIVSIAKDPLLPHSSKTLDAEGKIVLPGGIDFHVHFMDPGYTHREDWETGTQSAAAGGTTLVIDHGLTNPPTTTVQNFEKIIEIAEKKAVVDFGLNGAVTSYNSEELQKIAKRGAMAFGEIFMAESVPELESINDGVLFNTLLILGKLKALAAVHAENGGLVSYFAEKLKRAGRNDPLAHIEARPEICEAEAISRVLAFAKETQTRVHICHLTTEIGLKLINMAKSFGQAISCETCPHYLLFTEEDIKKYGPYLKCNPPIRTKRSKEALWLGLKDGTIDMVSSDHWPLPKAEKEAGWENIWEAGAGMPGVETRVPLLLTYGVSRGVISIETFVKVTSENPARILGVYPKKGAIAIGADADLIIVNMKKEIEIKNENLHTKAEFTPYEGWRVIMPEFTLVRGEMIVENGEIVGEKGYGVFISSNYGIDFNFTASAGQT